MPASKTSPILQAAEAGSCPTDGLPDPNCPVPGLGCRMRTATECVLLALASAQNLRDFWAGTRRFFHDFSPLHGMDLGISLEGNMPRTLCRTDGLPVASDWTETQSRLTFCGPFLEVNKGIPVFRMADAIPPVRLRKTEFHEKVMAPEGWEHAAALMTWRGDEPSGFVLLYRTTAQGKFTHQEMIRLRAYQPAFAAVFHHFTLSRPDAVRAASLQRQLENLTPEQIEIMRLTAAGRTNKEIAEMLGRSESGIKFHIHALNQRLGLRNRAALAACYRPGLRACG